MRPITYALLVGCAVWLVWDIVCVAKGYRGTISRVVWDNMARFPFIALMVGISIGHLFWPQYRADWWVELVDFTAFTAFMAYFYWTQRGTGA